MLARDGFVGQDSVGVVCPEFDETKLYLGTLCTKGNCEWGSTGKSLRYQVKKSCYLCRISKAKPTRLRTAENEIEPGKYLGSLCPNNHPYKNFSDKSLRYLKTGFCVQCNLESAKTDERKQQAAKRYTKPLQDIDGLPSGTRLGKLCKRAHRYEGSEQSLRRQDNGTCLACLKERNDRIASIYCQENKDKIAQKVKAKRRNDPEFRDKELARARAYRADPSNKEGFRRRSNQYYYRHRERLLAQGAEYDRLHPEKKKARAIKNRLANPVRYQNSVRARRARKLEAQTIPYTPEDLRTRMSLFNNCCAYCDAIFNLTRRREVHWDHVVPLIKGGHDALYNLLPACKHCNCRKSQKDFMVWYKAQSFFSEARLSLILSIIDFDKVGEPGSKLQSDRAGRHVQLVLEFEQSAQG